MKDIITSCVKLLSASSDQVCVHLHCLLGVQCLSATCLLCSHQLPQDLGLCGWTILWTLLNTIMRSCLWIWWHLISTFNGQVRISLLLEKLSQLCKNHTLTVGAERWLGTKAIGFRDHICQQCLKFLFQFWCLEAVLLNWAASVETAMNGCERD